MLTQRVLIDLQPHECSERGNGTGLQHRHRAHYLDIIHLLPSYRSLGNLYLPSVPPDILSILLKIVANALFQGPLWHEY